MATESSQVSEGGGFRGANIGSANAVTSLVPTDHFQILFENAPALNLILSPDLIISGVSNAYLSATLTNRDEILGRHLFDVFPDNPDDPSATGVANLKLSLSEVIRTLKPHTMALQRYDIRVPGEQEFFEVRYWSPINTPVLNDSGNLIWIIHRVEDVTELVQVREALGRDQSTKALLENQAAELERELLRKCQEVTAAKQRIEAHKKSAKQLHQLIDAMPDGVLVVNEIGSILHVNANSCQMFGLKQEEILRKSLVELLPCGQEQVDGRIRFSLDKPEPDTPYWILATRGDGSTFPATIATNHLETEDGTLSIFAIRDKSALRDALETVRLGKQRYQALLDNLLESVQLIGFDWRYIYLNDVAVQVAKSNREQMLGRTVMECFPGFENTEMYRALAHCMKNRVQRTQEFDFVFPSGDVSWFEFSIQPVPEGLFILALDITERKLWEEELKAKNTTLDRIVGERTRLLERANQELESFTYSVSHDLRAPLRHIHGYLELLGKSVEGQLNTKSKRYMEIIQAASDDMGHLIDDLLEFSRMGRIEFVSQRVPLNQLVAVTIDKLKEDIGDRQVQWDIHELPVIEGDLAMLRQVFGNLLSNALKYTRNRAEAVIEVDSYLDEHEVVVFVKDNGAGFEMEYVQKLFGVFQRLHRTDEFEGTGIGLAIVKRVIERHGGRVWAEGVPNEGATFFFSFSRKHLK